MSVTSSYDSLAMEMEMEMEMPNCGDGLSIMVIDDDTTSLMSLAIMLQQCSYKVTTTELASVALSMIRQDEGRFKLVMADLNLNYLSNLSFLLVLHKMNIPFILMSKERDQQVAEKAVAFGASLYFEKPISMNDLRHIWQHAYRIRRQPRFVAAKGDTLHGLDWTRNIVDPKERTITNDNCTTKYNQNKSSNPPKARKSRLVWNEQLHRKFAAVIKALGDEKARPKSILRMMNEPNLTHRQISSHLQKYKAQMKRINSSSNGGFNTNSSTSFYSEAGYLYMQQNLLNQPWRRQDQDFTLGFDPNNSMNQTLQLPNMSRAMDQKQDFTLGFAPSDSMNQTLQLPDISHQPMHQRQNFTLGFAPINSMNIQTQQLPNMSQSMYQNLNSTSAGNLVSPDNISEPYWTQTTPGLDKSVTDINVGNQEVETAAGGVTSAMLSENCNQHSPELAHLLKALDDDETDVCMGSVIEPNPDEIDQFCEWLKEGMQGNDENPGELGF